LLQALPVKTQTNEERADYWQHLTTLTDTLTDAELLALEPETILTRLYHQEQVRLYEPRDMAFGCSCSQVRTAEMLISLGREEVNAILEEQGSVDVDCQFCHQHYSFDQSQIDTLFSEEQRTLH
jgi:molecular chaperone Hsp33